MRLRLGAALFIFLLGGAATGEFGETNAGNILRVSLPGKTWAVEVHAEDFAIETDESPSDHNHRILANNATTGVVISVQLEQVGHEPTLEECRQFQRDRVKGHTGKIELQDIKYWDDGKMAFVEYLIPEVQGIPLRQRNLFACMAKEDVFVDIHLSKVRYEPKDELAFSAVMGTVYVADQNAGNAAGGGPTSMDLFREGTLLYNKGRFGESIAPYQKALDLEKKDPKLEKNFWRVLVDNLGMAYGMTGSLDKAKETFDYGVSQDKTYPLFYYNLACAYAEKDDLDDTMANLKAAFENKQNTIPGESMPDPRQDDSFQHFMKNKKFRDLVDSLIGPSQ